MLMLTTDSAGPVARRTRACTYVCVWACLGLAWHGWLQEGVAESGVSVAYTVLECDAGPLLAQERVSGRRARARCHWPAGGGVLVAACAPVAMHAHGCCHWRA